MKIGTHDSVTGESGIWWSKIFTPFARTQSKILIEQLNAGCTLFDIRVKKIGNTWRGAHGIWHTKENICKLIYDLCMEARNNGINIILTFTYEGNYKKQEEFINFIDSNFNYLYDWDNVTIGPISIKYGKNSKGFKVVYDIIRTPKVGWIGCKQEKCFLPLDGKTWHTYIPIPWLWKQFYFKNVEFDDINYKNVDFL